MIVEFGIACIAIFLWSFLPDGPARSAAFFAATSSWVLSLMVNLNPCMRFDGYYLLSDLCGFQNMQSSGFQLGSNLSCFAQAFRGLHFHYRSLSVFRRAD